MIPYFIFFVHLLNRIMRRTKCLSGAEKKKKRKRLDAVTQSQKGALDKFIVKKSQASSEVEAHTVEFDEGDNGDERADAYTDDEGDDANTDDEGNDANTGVEDNGVEDNDANVAYMILLTVPVTVASAKRSFSKLKLLKSYMRSTMTQERLSSLATIALESDILENINYEKMIEDFISRNTRRMMLFGRT
jgi:hypothetical protein